MKKIEVLLLTVIAVIVVFLTTCFIYTKEIRLFISNMYHIIISILILYVITNIYSTEIRDKKRDKNDVHKDSGIKYLANFSISFFTTFALFFGMHIILFIIEWIKSLLN